MLMAISIQGLSRPGNRAAVQGAEAGPLLRALRSTEPPGGYLGNKANWQRRRGGVDGIAAAVCSERRRSYPPQVDVRGAPPSL